MPKKSKKKKKRCTYCVYERLTRWNYRCVWYRNCSKVLNKEYCALQKKKMGHYMEMTRQNQSVFSHAPIYKDQSDATMTHGWDIWTIRNVRTDQNTTIYNFEWRKKTPQKPWYDNDRFGPNIPNSIFWLSLWHPKSDSRKMLKTSESSQ